VAASPSGTTSFGPDLGAISAFALGRSGVRRPEITSHNLADAAMAANLVLVDWSVDEPQLWGVELLSVPLVQGTVIYTLPANVLLVLDCYITTTVSGVPNDRVIYGVSRSEYDAYPNKLMQAYPTVFWANRVQPIQISMYPCPDDNGPYTLNLHVVTQDNDAIMTGATGLDLPYRGFSAFADALSAKLSLSYKPEAFQLLEAVAMKSYAMLRGQENESVSLYIIPGIQSYTRQ
jgi:hypothetical protein